MLFMLVSAVPSTQSHPSSFNPSSYNQLSYSSTGANMTSAPVAATTYIPAPQPTSTIGNNNGSSGYTQSRSLAAPGGGGGGGGGAAQSSQLYQSSSYGSAVGYQNRGGVVGGVVGGAHTAGGQSLVSQNTYGGLSSSGGVHAYGQQVQEQFAPVSAKLNSVSEKQLRCFDSNNASNATVSYPPGSAYAGGNVGGGHQSGGGLSYVGGNTGGMPSYQTTHLASGGGGMYGDGGDVRGTGGSSYPPTFGVTYQTQSVYNSGVGGGVTQMSNYPPPNAVSSDSSKLVGSLGRMNLNETVSPATVSQYQLAPNTDGSLTKGVGNQAPVTTMSKPTPAAASTKPLLTTSKCTDT